MTTAPPEAGLKRRKFKQLSDYEGIADGEVLEQIKQKAAALRNAMVVHVNATSLGGGVAEILDSFILLMNDIGVRTDWRVLHGSPDFFEVTKKFHNTLQGQDLSFAADEYKLYEFINEKFAQFADLGHDFVVIHDPQPCALVRFTDHTAPWVWRCHIDITKPNPAAWQFMQPFILEYEKMIVSSELYKVRSLSIDQQIISPSIDPLSPKNRDLDEETVSSYLAEYRIPTDKPYITQVSRFDPWKDPEGVLQVFENVVSEVDCRLIFCYNMASDDPEGVRIYERMKETAKEYLESGEVLFVRGDDPLLVNVLQKTSSVILQKSIREGFGLTITEAMWKGTPVVASNIGGIPTQIDDGVSGFLVEPLDYDGCAELVVRILQDAQLAEQIGQQARESVRDRFLITRHMLDYLELFLSL
jgi:trehalose synthase